MEPPLITPALSSDAVNPSPVPKVVQFHEPSALVPEAMRKPREQSCIAQPPVLVGLPSPSMGTELYMVPFSKLSYRYDMPSALNRSLSPSMSCCR